MITCSLRGSLRWGNERLGTLTPFVEGVRVGSGRADFLAALEDRVKTEEAQWSPLLQLHYPDKLDDYLNKVLVETGQRFFKKEPTDAPGYSDLAAKRRELLSQRLEARKSIGVDSLRGQDGLGRLEELEQKVLTAEEQLASTSAFLKAIRVRMRRRRQGFYEEELRLAWKKTDLAATFRWSRLLGGRRWGAKKRDYRAMTAALPSKKAWQDQWTKPGAEGGMSATVLGSWSEWRAQTSEEPRAQLPRAVKKRRNTSCGALDDVPPCLEEFVASGSDTRRRRSSLQASWPLWNGSCVVCDRRGLRLFRGTTAREPLCTKAMKPGPKGRRVVHVLPSMGKQFFKVLMRKKPNGGGWSQPEPADWLHGYIPGRRRESAVLIRQVTTWRLERLGLKSLTAFHDLTNAFGSVKWEALDRAVASLLRPDALVGQQRYMLATTTTPGRDSRLARAA